MRGLFRGKVDAKTWVCGSLVYSPSEDQYYIVEHTGDELQYPVWKDTVGQYTGINDKHGNKVFEGDVILFEDGVYSEYGYNDLIIRGIVEWYEDGAFFNVTNRYSASAEEALNMCEIIGNIYDNPELLEGVNVNE